MTKRGTPRKAKPQERPDEIPTRDNCNLADPDEMFLWVFTGAGGVTGAPLLMHTDYYRALSRQLYDAGARLVEEPTLKWKPPAAGSLSPLLAQGTWVPVDEQDDEEDLVAAQVAKLSPMVQERVREILNNKAKEGDNG